MRTSIILLFTCLFLGLNAFSQKTKTGVLVVGNSPAALAAAIQSAHSGVKTVLVSEGSLDTLTFSPEDTRYPVGIYAAFLKRVDSLQKKNSSLNHQSFVPTYIGSVFKGWTDTVKNLTVMKKTVVVGINRDGKSWEVDLNGRRQIKADVVVDATPKLLLAQKAEVKLPAAQAPDPIYSDKLYRTSFALGNKGSSYPFLVPAKRFLAEGAENFLVLGGPSKPTLLAGQGAGAAAAYCAFFNTSTEKLDVRKTQAELIAFGSQFIKLQDISLADSNAVAIQKIVLTGILKAEAMDNKLLFLPDSSISTEEIRSPMREYYSRSQIWFLDNRSEKINLKQALSLIKYCASRGDELDSQVEKAWKSSLRLPGKYDPQLILTRYQLAVLFANYLKPFERSIDLEGNLKS